MQATLAVGGVIGWNKPTGGNLSEGKAIWQEWKDMLGKPATVHSCYGKVILRAVIRNIGKNHPVEFQNGDQLVLTQKRIKNEKIYFNFIAHSDFRLYQPRWWLYRKI